MDTVIKRPVSTSQRQAILQAYARGYTTQEQAMAQLGIKELHTFLMLLERLCVQDWHELRTKDFPKLPTTHKDGSLSDGYANYFLSRNYELESE